MYFLNKTYTLDKDENMKEFLENFKVPSDQIKVMLNFKSSHTLKKDGDGYILSMTNPSDFNTNLKFNNGVEFDEEVAPGIFGKSKITIEGNVVTHTQKFGDRLCIIYRREYFGDQSVMIITTSNWDGAARRYFTAA